MEYAIKVDDFMDKIATPYATKPTQTRPAELLSAFSHYTSQTQVLSLDCFDTLIFRKTAKPTDVFYSLSQKPTFRSLGLSALLRQDGEKTASSINLVKKGSKQVTLNDIYQAINPCFTEDQINHLIDEELEAEMEACFALPLTIDLIRHAHSLHKKIMIVSDTYLQEHQLRRLLASKLPPDVMQMIDHVHCSCDHGKGKSDLLFPHLLESMKLKPNTILHIGDNYLADYVAAEKADMHAIHLIHHESPLNEIFRIMPTAASFIQPAIRNQAPLLSPFHALFASAKSLEKPETLIGYVTAGTILYAFAKFLIQEIQTLKQQGLRPKVLFLMRDAYLPSLVCEALNQAELGTPIRISRFTSHAVSFRSKEDIDRYIAERIKSERYQDICQQLLLSKETIATLLKKLHTSPHPQKTFIHFIHEPHIIDQIITASKAYTARLKRYLEKSVNMQAGDTFVFVDLGYSGTAQIKLTPIFKQEFNVDIIGRYLIGLRAPNWQTTRESLLSPKHFDDRALGMLVTYIAIFEQICTSTEKSVIDFDEAGNPIYTDIHFNEDQYIKLQQIQSECIRFALDMEAFLAKTGLSLDDATLRDAAATHLCRFLFLPIKQELHYLNSFQFDFNLGTRELLPMFDLDKGLLSLRRRSWLYSSKENLKNMRTNYPAEWRAANIELALTLMAQHRFGLEFAPEDLNQRRETVEIVTVQGQQIQPFPIEAMMTHDGYFSILIPVLTMHQQVALRLGLRYKWLEIDSAELIKLIALYSFSESEHAQDAAPFLSGESLDDKGGGLFECVNDQALLIFTKQATLPNQDYILRVIFRPIVKREQKA